MAEFNELRIIDYRQETDNTVSIAFDATFPAYNFIPGQYVNIDALVNGEKYRRAYSICSASHDNELRIAVKQIENGTVSVYLNNDVKVGDTLSLATPEGNFIHNTNSTSSNHYMMFGAGSGITPLMSMLKSILHDEPNSFITLFYTNKNKASIIFDSELTALEDKYSHFKIIHVLTDGSLGDSLLSNRIDINSAKEFITANTKSGYSNEFFSCGPEQMMKAVQEAAILLGNEEQQIHMEYFTAPVVDSEKVTIIMDEPTFEGMSSIEVLLDDEVFDFSLSTSGKTILEKCISEDIDPPFSCKGGVCISCKARVTKGKVTMDANNTLTDEEVADGYILTCQAHPASEVLKIDFDD